MGIEFDHYSMYWDLPSWSSMEIASLNLYLAEWSDSYSHSRAEVFTSDVGCGYTGVNNLYQRLGHHLGHGLGHRELAWDPSMPISYVRILRLGCG